MTSSIPKPWPQVLRARDAPDAAYEVFCRTPGVPPTDLRVRVFPPDSLLIEVRTQRLTARRSRNLMAAQCEPMPGRDGWQCRFANLHFHARLDGFGLLPPKQFGVMHSMPGLSVV